MARSCHQRRVVIRLQVLPAATNHAIGFPSLKATFFRSGRVDLGKGILDFLTTHQPWPPVARLVVGETEPEQQTATD